MIQVLVKDNLDEVLANPSQYVDTTFDLALLKVYPSDLMIMLGQDEETNAFYLVVEDDESSKDVYPEEGQTLSDLLDEILKEENNMSNKFTMTFDMDNAAFDDKDCEVTRILRVIARQVEAGGTSAKIFDINGNVVGSWNMD